MSPSDVVRDTIIRVRENEPFQPASFPGRLVGKSTRLGLIYKGDSAVGRLPVQIALFRLLPGDSGRAQEQLFDTLRADRPLKVANQQLSLLNVRQGTKLAYRYDPGLPWFYLAGALFLLGVLLRGFLPAYELYGTITEEEGETVIRIGGRALGLFTSLRPLVGRIVDRFEEPGA